MLEPDRTAWTAIWDGTRTPTWADMFGHASQSGVLAPEAASVIAEAARFLDDYFGLSWLPRALGVDGGRRPGIPELQKLSPLNPYGPDGRISDLLTWATALRTVHLADPPGARQLRKDARKNVSTHRLTHTLTEARLAAMGMAAKHEVEVEVQRGGLYADVVWRKGTSVAAIEVVTIASGDRWETGVHATDRAFEQLQALSGRHNIHFRGDLPPESLAAKTDNDWWQQLGRLCRRVSRTRRAQTMTTNWPTGHALHVMPGPPPQGNQLTGPLIEVDQGRRLLSRLRGKAEQTSRGGPAVIWIEDHGLLGPLTPFDALPLRAQLKEFAALINSILIQHPHLAAVVLSQSGWRRRPLPTEETVISGLGVGLSRQIGWDRNRRTVIVPGRASRHSITKMVQDTIDGERDLLDICLHSLTGIAHQADLFKVPNPSPTLPTLHSDHHSG